jgi:hypothetical protein
VVVRCLLELVFELKAVMFIMSFQDVGGLDDDEQGPFNGISEAPKLHLSQV